MRRNYLLIDFENVQPKHLGLLDGESFKVLLFLGAHQSKVPVELAKAMQRLGTDAEYIQISGNGSNALDFHIAFALGELSKADPEGYFHIISKDTGFDPLIQYARKKGVRIQRSREIAEVPMLKLSNAKTTEEKVSAVVQNLANRKTSRPRKVKTLSSTINALFRKALSDEELSNLVASLEKAGHISIEGESVSYHMQSAP